MANDNLLPVEEALAKILDLIKVLPGEKVSLLHALGRVLVEPVAAEDDLPPFANSAMDGFAVIAEDVAEASDNNPVTLAVIGDIPAGSAQLLTLRPATAARIMTGAPLPQKADAIVPVEFTDEPWRQPDRPLPSVISIYKPVRSGDHIRWPGEDVRKGAKILPAGHRIRPQEIGVLASLGVVEATVIQRPRVAILSTGDELIPIEEPLTPGKIRNSNSFTLRAQLKSLGADVVDLGTAKDTYSDVKARLAEGLSQNVNLFISTAGVSVGAYDVVKEVLEAGGAVSFWRVNMRPGKPLAFGTYGGVPYLGLPGNPVSAMVSFERFARPAILKMSGHVKVERSRITAVIQSEIFSDGRESYLRASVRKEDGRYIAELNGRQGSHVMTSLIEANGLLIVPAGVTRLAAGAKAEVMMLDWPESVF
ncbi:MAG: gephyrin-like molybdotransferase Glp [Candidatus Promineifilaceae bacterium]